MGETATGCGVLIGRPAKGSAGGRAIVSRPCKPGNVDAIWPRQLACAAGDSRSPASFLPLVRPLGILYNAEVIERMARLQESPRATMAAASIEKGPHREDIRQ